MSNKDNPIKINTLTIPIEVYKCEVILRNTQRLTELEKLVLKYIHINNSLKDVVKCFDINALIMDNILIKLFYKNLIQLDLNRAVVYLNNKIIKHIEDGTLDDYYDEVLIDEKRPFTIIQEKITGEIFIENELCEYFKNPGANISTYFDLTASSPETFIPLKDFSLDKYVKCVRKDLKSEPNNIIKINWLRPLHFSTLYFPLLEIDGIKQVKIDFECIPRHVQRAWQYAYEREFEDKEESSLDFISEEPYFLYNRNSIIYIHQELILHSEDLKKMVETGNMLGFRNLFEDIGYDLENFFNIISQKITSINNFKFLTEKTNYKASIFNEISKAENSIIISSPRLTSTCITLFSDELDNILTKDVKVFLIYSYNIYEDVEESSKVIEEILSAIKPQHKNNLFIIQSRIKFNSNFIIIDSQTVLYNNSEFLNFDFENVQIIVPTIIINGGNIPFTFLEFILELIPFNLKIREDFSKILIKKEDNLINKIEPERIKFLEIIKNEIESFKLLEAPNINIIINKLNIIKEIVNKLADYETITPILNLEHQGILIDSMRELSKEHTLITDTIYENQIGPNFKKYLKRIPDFSIILNTYNSSIDESKRNISLSKLDKIISEFPQLKYNVVEKQVKLNILGVKDGFIIFSNERVFSSPSSDYRRNKKSIGLLINSTKVNEIMEDLRKIFQE